MVRNILSCKFFWFTILVLLLQFQCNNNESTILIECHVGKIDVSFFVFPLFHVSDFRLVKYVSEGLPDGDSLSLSFIFL